MRGLVQTSLRLIEPPTFEPVELLRVKKNLRFASTSEDVLIDGWITAARQYFEQTTDRQAADAMWEYGLQACPYGRVIELPRPPLLEVVSVVYDDGDGVEQTLDAASYTVSASGTGSPSVVSDPFAPPGRVELAYGATWPTSIDRLNAVRIRFRAGYGYTVDEMPAIVQAAIYDLVRHFHRRPTEEVPLTTLTMLRMFRQTAIPTLPLWATA